MLFIDDGDVLTSAGSAAALDLSLHIVRRDYGTEVANHVGRRLVFAAFRDGGQRQFVEQPLPAATEARSRASSIGLWNGCTSNSASRIWPGRAG